MFIQKDLVKIKSELSDNVGQKVRLTAKKGRKQIVTREGVIESIYPSIFTVKLDALEPMTTERRVSYSYTDVLTKSVELILCDPNGEFEPSAEANLQDTSVEENDSFVFTDDTLL